MYDWISDTWNPLAGECPHKCVYCSTKSIPWKAVREKYSGALRLDEKAMKKNLGKGKTWFVCSQNDLFAKSVPAETINTVLNHCIKYPDNTYIFQTKNPARYLDFFFLFPDFILGSTIESNRDYGTSKAPASRHRMESMIELKGRKFVTIEPINDFDLDIFSIWIKYINPEFVNIGADSKKHNLPEPPAEKIIQLIEELKECGIEVRQKSNLERLVKP